MNAKNVDANSEADKAAEKLAKDKTFRKNQPTKLYLRSIPMKKSWSTSKLSIINIF